MKMEFQNVLGKKHFYRFTGPPEHWLTAIKYMTWGLEENLRPRWLNVRPGDIFFIHSTGPRAEAPEFNNARSGIIGLGVVGPDLTEKKNQLWYYELKNRVNKWPLLIPLSEVYLFSELPLPRSWEAPNPENVQSTRHLIDQLVANYIPLSEIERFPQMGSFSSVKDVVAQKILFDKRPLYLYSGYEELSGEAVAKVQDMHQPSRPLYEVSTAAEALRYADTLRVFDSVRARTLREPTAQYLRDNEILERANAIHTSILEQLISLFRKGGYETLSGPRSLDLFAHNGKRAFLFEVKSTENHNFRTQARKGIAQLFEYEYFDVQKFESESRLSFGEKHKLIVPSQKPGDVRYVEFINTLKIGVAMVGSGQLNPVGQDLGFSRL